MKKLEEELKISLEAFVPAYEFREIQELYNLDFLKECGSAHEIQNQRRLMSKDDIENILTKNYHVFSESHSESVRSVAITSDNKYIVSGSDDATLRIWNLQEKDKKQLYKVIFEV